MQNNQGTGISILTNYFLHIEKPSRRVWDLLPLKHFMDGQFEDLCRYLSNYGARELKTQRYVIHTNMSYSKEKDWNQL